MNLIDHLGVPIADFKTALWKRGISVLLTVFHTSFFGGGGEEPKYELIALLRDRLLVPELCSCSLILFDVTSGNGRCFTCLPLLLFAGHNEAGRLCENFL